MGSVSGEPREQRREGSGCRCEDASEGQPQQQKDEKANLLNAFTQVLTDAGCAANALNLGAGTAGVGSSQAMPEVTEPSP